MQTPRLSTDISRRFVIETANVRGQIVYLDQAWREILQRVAYPEVIRTVLGDACTATALLGSMLKFDGRLTLQMRGDGPVHLLVSQISATGGLRGLARWTQTPAAAADLGDLFADAYLTLSVDHGQGLPYAGTVVVQGRRLQDALMAYFATSEQAPAALWLSTTATRTAGMLLQRIANPDDDEEGWRRTTLLAETVQARELIELDAETLLMRLFADEDVRIYRPRTLRFECGCSRERSAAILQHFEAHEIQDMLAEQGCISVTCEFCGCEYRFDPVDCEQLKTAPVNTGVASRARH